MTDDRPFARRLHALADLSVAVLHVAALRSGCGAGNQTTNETARKDTREVLSRPPAGINPVEFGQTTKWDGDRLIVISAFWDAAVQQQQIGLA